LTVHPTAELGSGIRDWHYGVSTSAIGTAEIYEVPVRPASQPVDKEGGDTMDELRMRDGVLYKRGAFGFEVRVGELREAGGIGDSHDLETRGSGENWRITRNRGLCARPGFTIVSSEHRSGTLTANDWSGGYSGNVIGDDDFEGLRAEDEVEADADCEDDDYFDEDDETFDDHRAPVAQSEDSDSGAGLLVGGLLLAFLLAASARGK
jgi:hypothetical protein